MRVSDERLIKQRYLLLCRRLECLRPPEHGLTLDRRFLLTPALNAVEKYIRRHSEIATQRPRQVPGPPTVNHPVRTAPRFPIR